MKTSEITGASIEKVTSLCIILQLLCFVRTLIDIKDLPHHLHVITRIKIHLRVAITNCPIL